MNDHLTTKTIVSTKGGDEEENKKYKGHKVATETGIKCMAKYDYILKRKKKGNNNGHWNYITLSETGMKLQRKKKNGHSV